MCLDEWIRFNQRLWIDLFWPAQFDLERPLILLDERFGQWTNPGSVWGGNQQGDRVQIDTISVVESLSLIELLNEGALDAGQYQILLNAEASLGNALVLMTNWDDGWQTTRRCAFLSMRVSDGQFMNLILPYAEWTIKDQDEEPELTTCIVEVCACAQWNLPDLLPSYQQSYTIAICERLNANASQIQEIERQFRSCRRRKIGIGSLGIAAGCLGLVCPSGVTQVGGAIAIGAGAASIMDGMVECRQARSSAYLALAASFNQFVESQCFQACVASSQAPPP